MRGRMIAEDLKQAAKTLTNTRHVAKRKLKKKKKGRSEDSVDVTEQVVPSSSNSTSTRYFFEN